MTLSPQDQDRMEREHKILGLMLCVLSMLFTAYLLVTFLPSIPSLVDSGWEWVLTFRGIW